MSGRSWKKTRRRLKRIRKDLDESKRREMRVPWWVRILSVLVEPKLRASWVLNWQREHESKLRRAMKVTAHTFKGRI